MITFALCSPDTYDTERVGKDGTIFYPKTFLNFCHGVEMGMFVAWSTDRDRAKQFPTRAAAKRYAASIGRSHCRVMKIAVERLREDA